MSLDVTPDVPPPPFDPPATPFWPTLLADLRATLPPYAPTGPRLWLYLLGKVLLNPQQRITVLFRISQVLARHRLLPLAYALRSRAVKVGGAELHPRASIGPGFYVVHSTGLTINPYVIIGANCRIHHGVTVGAPGGTPNSRGGWTIVGDDVSIGTGAVILCGVTIGDGAIVGANAVVNRDVAPGDVVAGVPARVVRKAADRVEV